MKSTGAQGLCLDLPVKNGWENVELIRQAVVQSLSTVLDDPDECHGVATVVGELLENAVKYGHWTQGRPSFLRLRLQGFGEGLKVTVENPIDPDGENYDRLTHTLKWLQGFEDPALAYQERMFELAMSGGHGSRLGLARVAYEGNCTLSAQVEGKTLRMFGDIRL